MSIASLGKSSTNMCGHSQGCYFRVLGEQCERRKPSTAFAGLKHVLIKTKRRLVIHSNKPLRLPHEHLSLYMPFDQAHIEDQDHRRAARGTFVPSIPAIACMMHIPEQDPTRACTRADFGPMHDYTGTTPAAARTSNEKCSSATPRVGGCGFDARGRDQVQTDGCWEISR